MPQLAIAATLTIDLQGQYGVTLAGLQQAIGAARAHFLTAPDDVVTIIIPPGIYDVSREPTIGPQNSAINVSDIQPGIQGRLIIRGAGKDRTMLVFDRGMTEIYGRNVNHITFAGLQFAVNRPKTSQGHVVAALPGSVILDIAAGFPTPGELFNGESDRGRYLRKYIDSPTGPQIVEYNNEQIAWSSATPVGGNRWQINFQRPSYVSGYQPGDLIGIKSKMGGQAYWFLGGGDIVFDDIRWTQESRGVFRGGIGGVQILNAEIRRMPVNGQLPCLSSSGGGPQIGQPRDPPSAGNVVRNFYAEGTGDDAIAFFNASGSVDGVRISDSFARGILLYNSPEVSVSNATLLRCPLLRQ